ncbi:hypothetical protein I4U23_027678 [Adineta vaga]|nr:hypothetical protein I4U23_027678 [Adineta vaga]
MKNRIIKSSLMMKVLFFLSICLNLNEYVFGLNITYYSVEIELTNGTNISSLDSCLCQCLNSYNCGYFAYLSLNSSSLCQIYSIFGNKPNIINYTLSNNLDQTGLYEINSLDRQCNLSLPDPLLNYTNYSAANSYRALPSYQIISVLIMIINNQSRLLAVDAMNFSYFIFNINPLQIYQNDTFSPITCSPLCARSFNNLLYICCNVINTIQVRQFQFDVNSGYDKPELIKSYSTNTAGTPQCLAVLNEDILYYVTSSNNVYVLLTQTNTSILLYKFFSISFPSPHVVMALDSMNMRLYLTDQYGMLYRIELSLHGISLVSGMILDQYQMPWISPTSILLDKCNRLWALSFNNKQQIVVFIEDDSFYSTFQTMNMINYTNLLPLLTYSPYNFELDDNYSLFTANAHNGIYAFLRS